LSVWSFTVRGVFFCEQGAEGNNLDLKGSKGSLDKIEKEEIRHVESPDDFKMCE